MQFKDKYPEAKPLENFENGQIFCIRETVDCAICHWRSTRFADSSYVTPVCSEECLSKVINPPKMGKVLPFIRPKIDTDPMGVIIPLFPDSEPPKVA